MPNLSPAYAAMAEVPQWILADGKRPTSPHTVSGFPKGGHWQTDPTCWTTLEHAQTVLATLDPTRYRLGFLFTPSDPFVFVDLDHCVVDGAWTPVADTIMRGLSGALIELSQSGTGLHIFGKVSGPMPPHGCKNGDLGLELYSSGRFVVLTGSVLAGEAGYDLTGIMPALVAEYFPPKVSTDGAGPEWTDGPCAGYAGTQDDAALIKKMLASKPATSAAEAFGAETGKASFAQLWNNDVDALAPLWPGNKGPVDESSADMALASRLAWWTGGDCERIERLMRMSDLARDKWDAHPTYLNMTILNACSGLSGFYTQDRGLAAAAAREALPALGDAPGTSAVVSMEPSASDYTMLVPPMGGKGKSHTEVAILLRDQGVNLVFDTFRQQIVICSKLPWKNTDDDIGREWKFPDDVLELQNWLCEFAHTPTKESAADGVILWANRHRNNPLENYLGRIHWDGVSRLDNWLTTFLGVKNTEFTTQVGRKFLISAVARGLSPGCKADHMLILEGAQGIGKSSAVSALVPDEAWYTDELPDLSNRDAEIQLHGIWLLEVAEMDAMSRADASAAKKFVTRAVGVYRPLFARSTVRVGRSNVFIGTTNEESYFKDEGENRRFWPVTCGVCDIKGIEETRDQLWAEAVVAYKSGEAWWFDRAEEARVCRPEQEARRGDDPIENILAAYLDGNPDITATTTTLLFQTILTDERKSPERSRSVGYMLKRMGWTKSSVKRKIPEVCASPTFVYFRDPDDPRL